MKALLVCVSVSHGNTRRVADVLADVLGGEVVGPDEVGPEALAAADVLGLGSGVFHGRHHPALTAFVKGLPPGDGKPVFLFATSGMPELRARPFTRRLRRELAANGYRVVASFSCRGFDTWRPLRVVGGLNRGRPDAMDLAGARSFALELRHRLAVAGAPPPRPNR